MISSVFKLVAVTVVTQAKQRKALSTIAPYTHISPLGHRCFRVQAHDFFIDVLAWHD